MKPLLTILFLFLSLRLFAPAGYGIITIPGGEVIQPYERLWQAVCFVESNNDPSAVNKHEGAYGIAQIRKIRLRDYAKRTGKVYTVKDCFSYEVSHKIFMFYTYPDFEVTARCWNGGPSWRNKKATQNYWRKVQEYLNK